MKYSQTYMRLCKPAYKSGIAVMRVSMLLLLVGLVLGILGRGWITLFIGIGIFLLSNIISNLPTSYLVHFIKLYDEDISAKEATNIAQKHLQAPSASRDETVVFVHGVMIGVEKEKRLKKDH